MSYYILENKVPKKVDNVIDWAKTFQESDRVVEQTDFGDVRVSTVFVGINMAFYDDQQQLFETMIFGGEHDGYTDRYATWEEAVKGHNIACEKVKNK